MLAMISATFRIAATIVVGLAAWVSASATQCGDILGPGVHDLETDLQCVVVSQPALTLIGGATLEMHNHTLTCLPSPGHFTIGVQLQGERDVVSEGAIENCGFAVDAEGAGQHTIMKMNVTSGDNAINVGSDGNLLVDNIVSRGDFAYAIFSNNNVLRRNQSLSADGDAFVIIGSGNRLFENTVASSVCDGFEIGGSGNLLVGNVADGSFIAICGTFVIGGEANTMLWNVARNSESHGFDVGGSRHRLLHNTAVQNAGSGIEVRSGATRHVLIDNTATRNGGFDLRDDNAACDDNLWRANEFGTRNVDCIR